MVTVSGISTAIQVVSSAVLAAFTVVLAIATWRYYKQTREQTEEIAAQTSEMEKTRMLNYEPKMKAAIRNFYGPNFSLSFVNIGGGLAQEVSAEYYLEDHEDEKREWGKQVVFPEEVYDLGLPFPSGPEHGVTGGISEFEDALEEPGGSDMLVVKFEYQDSAGKSHNDLQRFSIFDSIEDQSESTEFYLDGQDEVTERPTF